MQSSRGPQDFVGATDMIETPLITLEGVSKTFGTVQVITDVTVDVRAGKVQVLLGENGA